jgi:hypothetical protein
MLVLCWDRSGRSEFALCRAIGAIVEVVRRRGRRVRLLSWHGRGVSDPDRPVFLAGVSTLSLPGRCADFERLLTTSFSPRLAAGGPRPAIVATLLIASSPAR